MRVLSTTLKSSSKETEERLSKSNVVVVDLVPRDRPDRVELKCEPVTADDGDAETIADDAGNFARDA